MRNLPQWPPSKPPDLANVNCAFIPSPFFECPCGALIRHQNSYLLAPSRGGYPNPTEPYYFQHGEDREAVLPIDCFSLLDEQLTTKMQRWVDEVHSYHARQAGGLESFDEEAERRRLLPQ